MFERIQEAHSPSLVNAHLIVDQVHEYAIFVVDPEGIIRSWNKGAQLLKQYTAEEIIGRPFAQLFTEEDRKAGQPEKEMAVAARDGRYESNGVRRRKDGSRFHAHVVLTAYRNDRGELEGFLKITRDITGELIARERAESERRRLEAILNRMPTPLLLLEPVTGAILFANQAAEASGGHFPKGEPAARWLEGHQIFDASGRRLQPQDLPVTRLLAGEEGRDQEYIWVVKGRRRHVLVHSGLIPAYDNQAALVVTFEDVTRLKESEEHLRQAQKMEAIGRLAGGVAHDFNNLLTAIRGYAELMDARMEDGDPNRADLGEIRRAAERAASLTNQLLAFSRKQIVAPAELDLNEVVASLERMLHRLIGEDIELTTQLHADAPRILADRGQVEQVLMNLVVNAKDAMPKGGKLLIATKDVVLEGGDRSLLFPAEPGGYVRLTVTDEGTGIPEDVRPHIFEPFFTTKGPGQGTGLGLSTVYAIARQNHANIGLATEPGRGTSFCVYWPKAGEQAARKAGRAEGAAGAGGGKTLLLVEDEPMVRNLTSRILEGAGYRVRAAENGEAALEILRGLEAPPDLLITDVVMGGMNGRELMEAAREVHPGLRCLFMSGYTDDEIIRRGVKSHGIGFIGKPFGAHDLLAKVRAVLAAEVSGDAVQADPG